MILIRLLTPLIYTVFIGLSFSIIFKREFVESIASAYFLQILFMLFSGMILGSLNIGIVLFFCTAVCAIVYGIARLDGKKWILEQISFKRIDSGFYVFILIYFIIYIINYGKYYNSWDEFSHWGIFIKESLRLDQLYCTSGAQMAHKDYVPAITLFETLWCRLSFRFNEADTYRGMQMLQISMMLPLAFKKHKKSYSCVNQVLNIIFKLVLVLCIPLYLSCDELFFYHTIYQDYIYGILVFYTVYLIITFGYNDFISQAFMVGLSITVLVMSKMTAMAFLPLLALLIIAVFCVENKTPLQITKITLLYMFIPTCIWIIFNKYASAYCSASGGQSYSGLDVGKLKNIIFHDGSISYQNLVETKFWDAMVNTPIFGRLSYASIVILIFVGMLYFIQTLTSRKNKILALIVLSWVIITAMYYAAMTMVLYLVSFTEYEASYLASYGRYMSTFVVAMIYIVLACFFKLEDIELSTKEAIFSMWLMLTVLLMTCSGGAQLIPGVISGEEASYIGETDLIKKNVADDEKVYIVCRGSNGSLATMLSYYCSPIHIDWGSPGEPEHEGDVYSMDYSVEDFYKLVREYDYIYFANVDDSFLNKYYQMFDSEQDIENDSFYRIIDEDGKVGLQ